MKNKASRILLTLILVCAVCSLAAAAPSPAPIGEEAKNAPVLAPAAPLNEGFEAGLVPPAGWNEVVTNTSYNWDISTDYPHGGDFAAMVAFDANQDEWLLSPPLTLAQGRLSFWSFGSVYYCRDAYDYCDLKVWIVVGQVGGADDILLGKAEQDWPASWTWAKSTYDLAPHLTGGTVRIGFEYVGNNGADISLDDIRIDSGTSLFLPLLLRAPGAP